MMDSGGKCSAVGLGNHNHVAGESSGDLLGVGEYDWRVMAVIYRHGCASTALILRELAADREELSEALRRLTDLEVIYSGANGWICLGTELLTARLAEAWDAKLATEADQLRAQIASKTPGAVPDETQQVATTSRSQEHPSWDEAVDEVLFFSHNTIDLAICGAGQKFSSDYLAKWVALIRRRRLTLRVLVHDEVAGLAQWQSVVAQLSEVAQEVRHCDQVLLDFAVIDGATVATCGASSAESLGRVTNQEVLVAAAAGRFADWWESGTTHTDLPADLTSLNTTQLRVVGQLLNGGNDEERAASMGVSVRTFQRYVAHLSEVLGVSTRTEIVTHCSGLVDRQEP